MHRGANSVQISRNVRWTGLMVVLLQIKVQMNLVGGNVELDWEGEYENSC